MLLVFGIILLLIALLIGVYAMFSQLPPRDDERE